MNIYEKVQKVRCDLQKMDLKKSGENQFAKYKYFELADFVPAINDLMQENKLIAICNFTKENATMTIINSEKPEEKIITEIPTDNAEMKGSLGIQKTGAVITYQRRYLYMAAFEITDVDIVDNAHDKKTKAKMDEQISLEQAESIKKALAGLDADVKAFCEYFKVVSVDSLCVGQLADVNKQIEAKRDKKTKEENKKNTKPEAGKVNDLVGGKDEK